MIDKRLLLGGFALGVGLGIAALAAPSAIQAASDFNRGLFGEPPARADAVVLRSDAASPKLVTPLSKEQREEVADGALLLLKDRYTSAAAKLSKYAMLGDPSAQSLIGGMYYFGKGFALDRAEGVQWLRLAAAQGDRLAQEALPAALSGTWEWKSSGADYDSQYAADEPSVSRWSERGWGSTHSYPSPDVSPYTSSSSTPSMSPYSGYSNVGSMAGGNAYGGAGRLVDDEDGTAPAYRNYVARGAVSSTIDFGSTVVLNPAGPGTYTDPSGDFYTQAGPHGVTNTRTGEFTPTN